MCLIYGFPPSNQFACKLDWAYPTWHHSRVFPQCCKSPDACNAVIQYFGIFIDTQARQQAGHKEVVNSF